MKRALGAVLPLLALWACEPTTLPAPSIVSVEPEQIPAGFPSALSVKVSAVLPLTVDYQTQDIDPAQLAMTVELAGKAVDIPFADRDGILVVPVPEGLAPGEYAIRVALADGRSALRERAFSVVTVPTPTGGNNGVFMGNTNQLAGFRFDPIEDQVRDSPFDVTLRGSGPTSDTFQAPVNLRASKGMVRTHTAGTFAQGVQMEQISLSLPGMHVYLLAEDAKGRKALSNSFRVNEH